MHGVQSVEEPDLHHFHLHGKIQGSPQYFSRRENATLVDGPDILAVTAMFWYYRLPPRSIPPINEVPPTTEKYTAVLHYRQRQYRQKSKYAHPQNKYGVPPNGSTVPPVSAET